MGKYRESNAQLFAISPQIPPQSRAIVEKLELDFEILYDKANTFAQRLDIVHGFPNELKNLYLETFGIDVAAANDDPAWTLPIPSRYVIDQEHKLKAVNVNASYTVRPEPEETLAVVMS